MKNFSIEIKWGIQFSIMSMAWMILEKTVGLHDAYIGDQLIYTNLFGVVAIAIYILAMRDKRKNFYHGTMDWKLGFLTGTVLTVVIAVLSPLVNYVIFTFITPDFFDHMIAYRVAHKYQTPVQAEAYFNLHSYIFLSISDTLSRGIITAAVIALFLKPKTTTK